MKLFPASQHLTVDSKYKSNALSAPSSNTAGLSDLPTPLFAYTHLPQGPSYPVLPVVAVKWLPNQARRFFSVITIAAEPRRVNDDKSCDWSSGPSDFRQHSCLIMAESFLKCNLRNGTGLLAFNYFSHSATSLSSSFTSCFLYFEANKNLPMQSRLSLGWLFLPGTGVWVKGGLQEDKKEKKYTFYYIRKAVKWIPKWLQAESTGCTTRHTGHWSAQSTQLSSHPQHVQE